jgi:hypothetical protein
VDYERHKTDDGRAGFEGPLGAIWPRNEAIARFASSRPLKQHGDAGMTLRDVVSACCGMIFLLLAPAQAFGVQCATEAQRKVETERLNKSVDWFLSIVEDVPESVARQFRDAVTGRAAAVNGPDMNAFRQAIAHPLWATHMIRETGAGIKRELHPQTPETPVGQLQRAISALERSAPFILQLSDYTAQNRGRRIIDMRDWTRRSIDLPGDLAAYAQCLVDNLVPSGANSSSPAAPR